MIFFEARVIPGSRVISFNFLLRVGGGEGRVQSPGLGQAFRICLLRSFLFPLATLSIMRRIHSL